MKGWDREHMEQVAIRNSALFEEDKEKFKDRMRILGWSEGEIEAMGRYLERRQRE